MMMDTAIQQTNNTVAQTPVTPLERQTIIQRLNSKWPLDLATRVENQAYEKSHGMKPAYSRFVQLYYQQVQVALHNRNNQQQQQQQTMTFSNPTPNHPQQVTVPVPNVNPMINQTARFPSVQSTPRMSNPIGSTVVNTMVPQKFNSVPSTTVPSFPPSVSTTTIDISQVHSSQRMNNPNSNDFQPRFSNLSRPRAPIPANNYPTITPSLNPSVNPNPSSSGDQLLQRILLSNIDGGNNPSTIQNRPTTTAPTIMSHTVRLPNPVNNNPNNSTRTSQQQLPPSPSVVVLPTSTVQVPPSTNVAIQQSPLNNNNNPQSISTTGSSPVNRSIPSAGSVNSDDEISNLVKYLKENVNRLQILMQKFTNDGNTEKIRQVQVVHQQIIQFINNPTIETLANAKHFREMLDRIPNRQAPSSQPPPPPTTTTTVPANVFNQCLKATSDFLLRDDKERVNVLKRYLEPLNDVINGVPHKIMRLDVDQTFSPIKLRSFHPTTFLNQLNDEINQLPKEIFAIERTCLTRFRERNYFDDEQSHRTGLILRCKLIEKHQPILPALQLQITTAYPEQAPEILSLTKSNPPRLDFLQDDEHPFFEQLSLIFVSHVFKLRPKHTVTEILHLWRLSVQTAL